MAQHDFAYRSSGSYLNVGRRDDAPYGLAGLTFDGAVTNRPGARFGPQAIRLASQMLCDATHPHFDTTPLDLLSDAGDLALPNTGIEAMRAALMPQAAELLRRHHMVWLGGDHSVTLPLLRALNQLHGGPVAMVHFDAHCDTWTSHFGEPSGHGTWVYEAMREGLLLPRASVQIGIRSSGERAAREYVNEMGGRVYTARELRGLESPAQLAPVLGEIRARMAAAGNPPLYLTLDIDCLDPAFAPGTGTPEPGGLSSNQVLSIIEELADLNWCGMDCVEVAPPYDHAELTSNAASTFVWTYLCGQIAKRGRQSATAA
ncbi:MULTISPECIES: agmatinase [unclassified Janthinobacterium]|uniref:agmatinase n=1 Tax=unclassified Janthinobacterium TaxID=2610881 RepID=UPI00034828CE|nr:MULTISPECIES: agmatinase [unclassified Janthinobacterium]MEC5161621.1 agmatinase [Janthinobacterium sp. CG_S6]